MGYNLKRTINNKIHLEPMWWFSLPSHQQTEISGCKSMLMYCVGNSQSCSQFHHSLFPILLSIFSSISTSLSLSHCVSVPVNHKNGFSSIEIRLLNNGVFILFLGTKYNYMIRCMNIQNKMDKYTPFYG